MIIHVRTSANFREIRMGDIVSGILYRSSHPIADGREDIAITKLAVQAQIAAIINLADTNGEIQRKAVLAPWYRRILNAGGVIALGMNFDCMSRPFCVQLRQGIQFMLNHPGPCLIHCYAGVDRTGFVAIILETLMGASLHEVIDDYLGSFLDKELLAPPDSPQYNLDSLVVYELLTKINNGSPVREDNLKEVAEKYLLKKVMLTMPELELLKKRLAGEVLFT
jgi:hypothetical protein